MKKAFLMLSLFLFVTTAVIGVSTIGKNESVKMEVDVPVAYVNDVPVSAGLLSLVLNEKRGEVASYFMKNGQKMSETFWTDEYNGEVPRDVLLTCALEKCRYIVLCQKEASLKGVYKQQNYSSFLEELKKLNSDRRSTVEEGGIIYGPIEYSESDYFTYKFSNMEIGLKASLEEAFEISEEELNTLYADKVSRGLTKGYSEALNGLRKDILNIKYESYMENIVKNSSVKLMNGNCEKVLDKAISF